MRVFDCFCFFNELDLLEYRFELLYNYVDYFVIVEANCGFSGKPKPYVLQEHLSRYDKYKDKIVYWKIGFDKLSDIQSSDDLELAKCWQREEYQRDAIKDALVSVNVQEEDLIFITDVDEIINSQCVSCIQEHSSNAKQTVYSLEMILFMYCLHHQDQSIWHKGKAVRWCLLKDKTTTEIRHQHLSVNATNCVSVRNAGWHLSYFGGVDNIHAKLCNFSHQEQIVQRFNTLHGIHNLIKGHANVHNNVIEFVSKLSSISNLPPNVDYLQSKFGHVCAKFHPYAT